MGQKFNIGEIIRAEFEKTGWSVAYFAEKIHRDRTIAYRIFSRKLIDTTLLYDISMALNVDFFKYYSDWLELENESIRGQKEQNQKAANVKKKRVLVEFELTEEELALFLREHSLE